MKKKTISIVMILLFTTICIIFSIIIYNKNNQEQNKKRYDEIKQNVKKAVEWNINAQYPYCSISNDFKKTGVGSYYNSWFLINNGYIKKSELLDVDKKSYCDVYVDINSYYEDPLDHQKNCEIYYKIYLKCKNYTDKGYINWGD